MTVRVTCPNPDCGAGANVEEQSLGKRGRCKKCGRVFALAGPDGETASRMSGDASAWKQGSSPASPANLPEPFGRYRIMKTLGQGGMGAVYLAHDTRLDRQVALKVPFFQPSEGPQAVQRFEREARAVATLDHPNLCPIFDVGEVDGIPYLTMPYIEGKTLAEAIPGNRALPEAQAAAVARKLALALHEAHAKGIIHRDLKPGNIMVNRRRELIIMDFGLARISGGEDIAITRVGHVLGTALYMAPEQASAEAAIGPAADIYSLGVILHELLTGRRPFEGPWSLVIGLKNVKDPDPPSTHRPGLSPALEAICLKAIARDPKDRYPSMAAFAEGLATFLDGGTGPDAPVKTSGVARSMKDLVAQALAGLVSREEEPALARESATGPDGNRPRRAGIIAAGAAACCLLLGVIFYIATDKGRIKIVVDDPKAVVKVDGQEVLIEGLGDPITLRAGEHTLSVRRGDGEFEAKTFVVHRGGNEVLRAALLPQGGDGVAIDGIGVAKIPDQRKLDTTGPATNASPTTLEALTAAARRFRPGATWVGTWTFESPAVFGEVWPYMVTVTKRSGDRFEAAGTLIHLGMKEIHSSQSGTFRGVQVENTYEGSTGSKLTIVGTIDGRELRFMFKGSNDKKEAIFGRGTLAYQGPMEPLPRQIQGREDVGDLEPAGGADRLKLIGHWDHRPGDVRRDVELMASGMAKMGGWRGSWTLGGDRLILRWPTTKAPGQAWVDDLIVSADRKKYEGKTLVGDAIIGSHKGGGGHGGMPVIDYESEMVPGVEKGPTAEKLAKSLESADLERFQGTWDRASLERSGEALAPANDTATYEGDRLTLKHDGAVTGRGIITLHPERSPRTMDTLNLDENGAEQGPPMLGIYEFTDQGLRLCFSKKGEDRPGAFSTTSGAGWLLMAYKRPANRSGGGSAASIVQGIRSGGGSTGGEWSLQGDRLIQSDAGVRWPVLMFGDESWTDYDFSVDLMRTKGIGSINLFARCLDEKEHVDFGISGKGDYKYSHVEAYEGGQYRVLKILPFQIRNDRWYNARIGVRGPKVDARIFEEGREILHLESSDDRHPKGKVGLATWFAAYVFKDIKVTAPDGSVLWDGPPIIGPDAGKVPDDFQPK